MSFGWMFNSSNQCIVSGCIYGIYQITRSIFSFTKLLVKQFGSHIFLESTTTCNCFMELGQNCSFSWTPQTTSQHCFQEVPTIHRLERTSGFNLSSPARSQPNLKSQIVHRFTTALCYTNVQMWNVCLWSNRLGTRKIGCLQKLVPV